MFPPMCWLVQVPLVSVALKRKRGGGGKNDDMEREEEEGLLDRPLWSYVSDRITRVLREGLGDRCVLARPLCGVAGEVGDDFQGARKKRDAVYLLLVSELTGLALFSIFFQQNNCPMRC